MIRMYEARDRKDKYWYSLDNLEKMHDNDALNYSYVHKRLECPCCENQVLTCKIDEEFAEILSKRSEHKKTCDYYGFKLSQNKVKQQLNSLDGFTKEYHGVIHGHPETDKAIGRRGIERRLTEDDLLVTKMFYGNAVIKTAHSRDEEKYLNFSVKAPKGDAITLSFQKSVFDSLKPEIDYLNANLDKELFICFIGSIKKNEKYFNLIIDKPNQIVIKDLYLNQKDVPKK
ncbi:hypothetical protein RZE82_05045 [Mollicutes bacterium LVI A0039]|nr:hypothetical protein RZE82_05045 [Mollicutes bacterium LVI A0039]